MLNRFHFYILLIATGALALTILADWSALAYLRASDWLGLGVFAGLALLGLSLEVGSNLGAAKPIRVSITFLPLLAAAVVMPVPAVILAAGVTSSLHELIIKERKPWRSVFNISQAIIIFGLGATVYRVLLSLGGQQFNLERIATISGISGVLIPFLALAITCFSLNSALVSVALALRHAEPVAAVLAELIFRSGANFLYGLLSAPIALFMAFLYDNYHVGGLLLVILPLLLVRHSYLSAIQLDQANRNLLKVLVKTIETRDPYTSGHSLRVSQLAKLVASDYGFRPRFVDNIETAALLHDIGKIDVEYADVISKPHDLTDDERRLIRTHGTRGADLLQSLTSLDKSVIAGVRHHHEWYDGSGYPDGQVGKSIPLAARIIMICDAVDAMLSDRPYRRALPISKVRSELHQNSGTQFDPDLVGTILNNRTLERAQMLVGGSGADQATRGSSWLTVAQ